MRLFDRKYTLTVDGLSWSDPLHIEFEVELMASRSSGKATITIFNLSRSSAAAIESGRTVKLVAGYADIAGQIFSGSINPRMVRVERDRVIIESLAQPSDLLTGIVNLGYQSAVNNRTIVAALASAAGLVAAEQTLTPSKNYAGWAWAGSIRSALDELSEDIDGTWWVQGAALYMLPSGSTLSSAVVELSQATGLIGTPARGSGLVEATSLLNPLLLPGTQVALSSSAASGSYRIQSVVHSGSYQGGDWTTLARLKAM